MIAAQTKTVVNNESSEIIQILNTAFNDVEGVGNPGLDLAPKTAQEKAFANEVDDWLYDEVCNGVYKAGFAKSQQAYDRAVTSLFDHLEKYVFPAGGEMNGGGGRGLEGTEHMESGPQEQMVNRYFSFFLFIVLLRISSQF